MPLQTPESTAPQLDHVAIQFAHWRQHRAHPSERIPQALWDQAVALTRELSYSHVAKQLRLSPSDLKQQMLAPHAPACPTPGSPVRFVEVPRTPEAPRTRPETEIEMQRADGAHLRLRSSEASLPLAAVVRAFLEVS
jgi:hypothetical protein